MSTTHSRSGRSLRQSHWPDHSELRATIQIDIPFQDADPTGFAWHGNYFRYFDQARTALLKKLDFSYQQMADASQFWPIVDTRVRYLRSIYYADAVIVSAQLVEWEFRLRIFYEIHNKDQQLINEAYTIQVPVNTKTEELIIGSPQVLLDRIEHLLK